MGQWDTMRKCALFATINLSQLLWDTWDSRKIGAILPTGVGKMAVGTAKKYVFLNNLRIDYVCSIGYFLLYIIDFT